MSNKGGTLFEGSREKSRTSIKRRLFEGSIGLRETPWHTLFEGGIIEDCWTGVPHGLIKGMIMSL